MLVSSISQSRSATTWDPDPNRRPATNFVGELRRVQDMPAADHRRRQEPRPDSSSLILTVEVGDDDDFESIIDAIPPEGFLLSSVGGSMQPLTHERRAIDRLRRGLHHNAYLGHTLFEPRNSAGPGLVADALAANAAMVPLDDEQRQAVSKALATPDLLCLLGPPGTGKTQTILEIGRQVIQRGGRCLISSQPNLAIENVFVRIPDQLTIRPLRIAQTEPAHRSSGCPSDCRGSVHPGWSNGRRCSLCPATRWA
jgi:hypothetical protein